MRMSLLKLLCIYAVFGTFSVLFVRGLWFGVPVYRNAQASAQWPSTEGTILTNRVDRAVSQNGRSVSYSAEVTYRYSVNGQSYGADRIRFGTEGGSGEEEQRQVAARFAVGARVKVYYDPDRPAVSTLLAGPREQSFLGLWLTIALLALCLLPLGVATWLALNPQALE